MTIHNIAVAAKNHLDELEERSPRFWNDLGVDEVAAILRLISNAFFSMNQLASEASDIDKSKILSGVQLEKIMCLLSELTDNFFPMAHTQDHLGNLKIINYREFDIIQRMHQDDMNQMRDCLRHIKDLNDRAINLVNQIDENHERIIQNLNP
jgi:hypothetical protein